MKFRVIGIMSATVDLGVYEAENEEEAIEKAGENEEEAIEKAGENEEANWTPSLCHQCFNDVELGDIYKEEAEEIE